MRVSRNIAAALALVLSALAAPAQAQDAAAAKALFNEGLADMEAAHYDTGCPALAESYRLDPRPGTLFTLAECENKRGRLATAAARYDEYLAFCARLPSDQQKKQVDRMKVANDQKAALAPLVPMLTLTLPPDAPQGTVVRRDGKELAASSLGRALALDPGEHVISAQVPGSAANERRVTLYKGEKKQILLDVRPAAARPGVGSPPPKPKVKPEVVPGPAPGEGGDSGPSGRRVAAYVVGGVGAFGLILGGVMGGVTLANKSVILQNCGKDPRDPTLCNDTGFNAATAAKTSGLISTVSFAVGGAGIVAGAVLLLTAPKRAPAAPPKGVQAGVLSIGREGTTVGLRGAW